MNQLSNLHCRVSSLLALTAALVVLPVFQAGAQEVLIEKGDMPARVKEYSPYVDDNFPKRVLFGDIQQHSAHSDGIGSADECYLRIFQGRDGEVLFCLTDDPLDKSGNTSDFRG